MKRLLLLAVFSLFAVCASAQYQTYYVVEFLGEGYPSFAEFKIDFTNKFFYFDSDSPDESNAPIKNLKQSGKKKTFDVWAPPALGNIKICSIELTEEGEDTFKLIYKDPDGLADPYLVSTKAPAGAAFGIGGGKDPKAKVKEKADAVKDAVTKGITKGLDALKKKDKK